MARETVTGEPAGRPPGGLTDPVETAGTAGTAGDAAEGTGTTGAPREAAAAVPEAAPGGRPALAVRIRAGGRAGWPRLLTAIAAGLIMWTAFPPIGWWPLAPVGVAALTLALRGLPAASAARLGFLSGLAFFVPVLEGIAKIGPDAWLLLSATEAAYFAPMGAGVAIAGRLRGWPVWTAALWVAQEALRGRAPFGGFPWARLAFSQTATPLTPLAALGGAPLVTFATALIGCLAAAALVAVMAPAGRALVRAALPALLGAVAVAGLPFAIPVPTSGRPVTVAVVQGNVPRLGLDFLGQRAAVLDNHARRTHELAAQVRAGRLPRPQLVVWPENSSDLDPYLDPQARAVIDGAVRDIGVPVLVGAVIDSADGVHVENRGIVWDPRTGPGAYYVKRHPVPFGEYLPFRAILTKLITRFQRVPRDFLAGGRPGLLRLGPVRIGDVICFEVAYDGVVRDVSSGDVLVVQTNNATYGRTSLPPQQIAMSRLRAVEHGRTILVAATSGISAIVAPDGRMIDRSREFTPDIQVARVRARTSSTISDRLGAAPEWAAVLVGLVAVAAAARAGGRDDRKA